MSNYAPQPTKDYETPYEAEPQVQKKKSGCFKGCLIIGIVGVVGMVLCCVGVSIYFMNSFSEEPGKVNEIAKGILEWPLVEEMDGRAIGSSASILKMAMKGGNQGDLLLMLESFIATDNATAEQMRDAIFDSLAKNQDLFNAEEVNSIQPGKETIELRGDDVTFDFDEVEGVISKDRYWEVSGVVPKGEGRVAIYLRLPADKYSRQEVVDQIKRIQ